MKKWVIIITIILSVGLGTRNVKAVSSDVYDMSNWIDVSEFTLPNGVNSDDYYLMIYECQNKYFLVYFTKDRGYKFYRLSDNNSSFPYPNTNININARNPSATFYTTNDLNSKVFSNYGGNGYSSYNLIDKIVYINTDIYNSTINSLWFNLSLVSEDLPTPELHISDTHDSTNHNATITVDTSDFASGDYKYKWGYDPLLMNDITTGTNGFTITVPYSDDIIFSVLNQDDTLVYETTYTINYSDMPNQYAFHYHATNNYGSRDFVKLVYDNTDYTDEHFYTELEKLILFNNHIVSLGFYSDMGFNNEIRLDGTICYETDLDIYIKWSTKIPLYTPTIYVDEDIIKLDLNFTEWLSESQNLKLEIAWYTLDNQLNSWVYDYSKYQNNNKYTATDLKPDTTIVLKWFYLENGHAKYIREDNFSVKGWLVSNGTEELKAEIELIEQANTISDSNDALDSFNKFIQIISVPLNFIKNIVAYLYEKLNTHTKIFLVGIFVAKLLTTLGKRVIKK